MKIISLNVWHGALLDAIGEFITKEKSTTDVFCFQESDAIARDALRQFLPDYVEYAHDKRIEDTDDPDHNHNELATYVKDIHQVQKSYNLLSGVGDTGAALVVEMHAGNDILTVVNVHGKSYRVDDKLDTGGRLIQTDTILETSREADNPVVIIGDFNLEPLARSVQLFASNGYRDLIADSKITTTRNRLAWERFPDKIQYFADYAFVNPFVDVRKFEVPDLEISDHLPLILDVGFISEK